MSRHRKYSSRKRNTIPSELQASFARFAAEVQQANDKGNTPDYRDAIRILNEHPSLTRYLETTMERRQAEAQALGKDAIPYAASYAVPGLEDSFFSQKASGPPTGSHPQNHDAASGWSNGGSASKNAPQGVSNAALLRYFADNNEWVRAAINIRRQQVGRADIAVVPHDERKPWNRQIMKEVQQLLDQPNIYRDSYRSLIEPVIEDILVIDRGVVSKNMTPGKGRMSKGRVAKELYYEDGATIKIYADWDGTPSKPRYLYEEQGTNTKVPLRNDELICMMANPATYRLGLSPVQFLMKTIKAEMRAIESATHIVDMKPAPHIVQIPGAHQTQISNIRNSYDAEIAGRKELFWMGGDSTANVFKLTFSARDSQWLEWQQWLARKIATAFQISPQQFGFTQDINKSNGEIQQQIYEDTGLIPLLLLIEEYMNRELLMDFCPTLPDGRANLEALNLRIIYPDVSETERQMHMERSANVAQQLLGGLPGATLNQVLMMRGEEPVKGGNTFWIKTATGAVPLVSYDHDYGDWNPFASLGGALGSQDPFGGPDEGQDDPSGGGKNEPPAAVGTPPGAAASSPAGKPNSGSGQQGSGPKKPANASPKAGDQSSASGNAAAPNFSADAAPPLHRKRFDTRRPGHRWTPNVYHFDDEEPV